MATFRFYQDIEVIATRREYYEIEAESLEEARDKVGGVSNLDECKEAEYDYSEFMYESEDYSGKVHGIYDSEGEEIE